MGKTLKFHEARKLSDGSIKTGAARYLMISEIHRIEALSERHPERENGSQALIVCRGKDGSTYTTAETADELAAALD